MFFKTKLSRLALSSLAAASTLVSVGIFSSLTSPVAAQVNQCVGIEPDADVTPITEIPAAEQPFLQLAQRELQARGINAQIQSFNTEQEDVGTIYEFQALGPDGCGIEVDIIGLDELEREILSATLQQEAPLVAQALTAQGITPTFIERSDRPGGVVVYEIEGTNAQGQAVEAEFNPDGTLIGEIELAE